jgi:hypothetical protein
MNLDVLATTPGLPSQICTAQHHPVAHRLQNILEPAVGFLHFDSVKFTGAVHHRTVTKTKCLPGLVLVALVMAVC